MTREVGIGQPLFVISFGLPRPLFTINRLLIRWVRYHLWPSPHNTHSSGQNRLVQSISTSWRSWVVKWGRWRKMLTSIKGTQLKRAFASWIAFVVPPRQVLLVGGVSRWDDISAKLSFPSWFTLSQHSTFDVMINHGDHLKRLVSIKLILRKDFFVSHFPSVTSPESRESTRPCLRTRLRPKCWQLSMNVSYLVAYLHTLSQAIVPLYLYFVFVFGISLEGKLTAFNESFLRLVASPVSLSHMWKPDCIAISALWVLKYFWLTLTHGKSVLKTWLHF